MLTQCSQALDSDQISSWHRVLGFEIRCVLKAWPVLLSSEGDSGAHF